MPHWNKYELFWGKIAWNLDALNVIEMVPSKLENFCCFNGHFGDLLHAIGFVRHCWKAQQLLSLGDD